MSGAKVPCYPWEVGVLQIAIDPAILDSGIAIKGVEAGGTGIIRTFLATEITEAEGVSEKIRLYVLDSGIVFSRVLLSVEYPTWNRGASPTIRAAANSWIRVVKRLFPRKVTVRKIDPNVWQKSFSYRDRPPTWTTKDYSLYLAKNAYRWPVENHNEADAVMILEHSRLTPLPAPAPKKKRAP